MHCSFLPEQASEKIGEKRGQKLRNGRLALAKTPNQIPTIKCPKAIEMEAFKNERFSEGINCLHYTILKAFISTVLVSSFNIRVEKQCRTVKHSFWKLFTSVGSFLAHFEAILGRFSFDFITIFYCITGQSNF